MKVIAEKAIKTSPWQIAWSSSEFRKKIIVGGVCLLVIVSLFPLFFEKIEKRNGFVLQDWFLDQIPAYDVSVPIFIILYSISLLGFIRIYQSPSVAIMGMWCYVLLFLTRMITISLVALNPPTDFIPLVDPASVIFYGSNTITKDLFFSGHTSTLFIAALCFENKIDKIITFAASIAIGLLLLVQRVHYTIDILGAFIFCYAIWYLVKRITNNQKVISK